MITEKIEKNPNKKKLKKKLNDNGNDRNDRRAYIHKKTTLFELYILYLFILEF